MSAADSNTSLPEKKSGYTFGHNETLLLISLYQKYEVSFKQSPCLFARKIAAITAAIFVTQCLLVPGPRISTGVFLCRQSELFLAFRTNHSHSRIVNKKTHPKCFVRVTYISSCVTSRCSYTFTGAWV